ncbi:MAG: hypothetical protein OYH77_08885 [Pseudomonadota bacterium]|nr:hypothetical protein [Pseudomonadota bacterium]
MMSSLSKITLCCVCFSACQADDSNDGQVSAVVPVAKVSKKIGLRNFQEINLTMSTLTGIDHHAKPIRDVYDTVSSMLPLDNSASAFHPPVQVAVFRLASAYCHQLINLGKGRNDIFPAIDFEADATVALAPDKRDRVAAAFIAAFWERSSSATLPTSESRSIIVQYISEALGEHSAVQDAERYIAKDVAPMQQTKEVLFTVCNAMLASAPVMFH